MGTSKERENEIFSLLIKTDCDETQNSTEFAILTYKIKVAGAIANMSEGNTSLAEFSKEDICVHFISDIEGFKNALSEATKDDEIPINPLTFDMVFAADDQKERTIYLHNCSDFDYDEFCVVKGKKPEITIFNGLMFNAPSGGHEYYLRLSEEMAQDISLMYDDDEDDDDE